MSRLPLPAPPLLVISDRSQARRPLISIAEAAFRGGCRWFSLREKDLSPLERCELLEQLIVLGRAYDATVGVHEDVATALVAGAGALHLPSGTGFIGEAKARMPRRLIGASAHSAGDAAALIRAGADYVTISPIFLTDSKPGYGPALGLAGLAEAVAAAAGPVVALAGINPRNVRACIGAGAAGVAVMGDVMRAADPEATVRALIAAIT